MHTTPTNGAAMPIADARVFHLPGDVTINLVTVTDEDGTEQGAQITAPDEPLDRETLGALAEALAALAEDLA